MSKKLNKIKQNNKRKQSWISCIFGFQESILNKKINNCIKVCK